MIPFFRSCLPLFGGVVVLLALASCATTPNAASQDSDNNIVELFESTIETTTSAAKDVGNFAVDLVRKPIDYVRGNLLYGKRDSAGRTVLHYAVIEKNIEEVTRLLSEGAPQKYDRESFQPYHVAIVQNDPAMLQVFADFGQELNKPTNKKLLPLHLAAANDADQSFAWLLKAGLNPLEQAPGTLDAIRHGIAQNKSRFLATLKQDIDLQAFDASGDSLIHFATRTLNPQAITQLNQLGVPIDLANQHQETPLLLAASQPRSQAVIEAIIAAGANVNLPDPTGDTPAIRAIRANQPVNVQLLLQAEADLNTPDAQGHAPLFIALPTNNGDFIAQFAQAGINLDQYNAKGLTPLLYATSKNLHRMVDPLITNGAKVDYPMQGNGVTPLMLAARLGHTKIQGTLKRHKASHRARDIAGNTVLHYASAFNQAKSITVALSQSLINNGRNNSNTPDENTNGDTPIADINAQNYRGETPLHSAIYNTSDTSFKTLFKYKPDLSLRDKKNNQPLHAALYTGNLNFARNLIKNNAPVDALNPAGDTPLVSSIKYNNLDMINALINNKKNTASVVIKDEQGRLPIHIAAIQGRPEAIIQLARAQSPIDPIDAFGYTPLHLAAAAGHFVAVRALLRQGAFINALDSKGNTPLHLAALQDQPNVVQELMLAGADATIRNQEQSTALFSALEANSLDSFSPIIRDSNPHVRDLSGNTVLMVAIKQSKAEAVARLVKLGVSVQYGNAFGETPLSMALRLGNSGLINVLANAGADVTTPLGPDGSDLCELAAATQAPASQVTELGNSQLQFADNATQATDASLPAPTNPLALWQSDCFNYINNAAYLSTRSRWLLLGDTAHYQASRWWQRIPLPSSDDTHTLDAVNADAQAKLYYYLTYSRPDKYLPPLGAPDAPDFSQVERQRYESDAAYIERLDFYQKEYQSKHQSKINDYLNRKENRLERIADLQQWHQNRTIAPQRPAISFIADSLQHHYAAPFYAISGVLDPKTQAFIIELPLAQTEETLVITLTESQYPKHFAFIRANWRTMPWYLGTLVTANSYSFVEVATQTSEGLLFIPINQDVLGESKVVINSFTQF